MEWTPQHKFQPPITYRAPQAERVFNEPSPFHGAIPPAPISWAQRLRYPPSQPQFRKASEKTKENFFTRNTRRVASDAASDVSSVAPSVADSSIFEIDSPVQFAAPRFFAPTDRMETGLESLFGDAFSLGKEPLLQGQQDVQTAMPPVAFRPLSRLMTSLISGASCVTWDYAPVIHPTSPNLARLVSVAVALMILVYNLVSSIGLLRTYRSLGYTALQGLQCALALVVGRTIRVLSKNGKEKDEINALGLWFLMALTVQEVWGFISSLSAPSVATAVEAPKPLVREKQTPSIAKRTAKGGSQAVVNKAPAASASTALSTKAKSNRVEMTQRTTRSKARNEARGDSLGVDGLGSLSLSGW